ncbi:MAG: HAD family hydrolase [Candidatus Tectomicrobia bacterium]|nr:HAD family hydrolase [Candidatus Tectomicrobia bacterium]MBI2179147.1 HAD family hydrolase [Candidatus Tectomicrobia bacterium]
MRNGAEGVLLDFDGTLTKPAFDWPAMQREMALPAAPQAAGRLGAPGEVSILDYLAAAPVPEAARVAAILERHEVEAARRAEAMEGAHDLIAFLERRGAPFGVVTNNARRHVLPMLERTGLSIGTLVTRDIGVWKPDPRHVLAGAEAIGVRPGRCVLLGDGRFDMMAARAAGMTAVHLSPGPGLPCDYRVSTLAEATELLGRLLG